LKRHHDRLRKARHRKTAESRAAAKRDAEDTNVVHPFADHVQDEEKRVLNKQTCITDNDDGSKLRQCQRRRADLQLVEEFQSRMDILAASAAVVMRVPDTTERLQTNMPLHEAVSVLSSMNANLMQLPRDVEKQKELKWRAQMWAAKAVEKADAVQREALRAEVHASAAKRSADAALAAAEKEKEKATKKIKLAESKVQEACSIKAANLRLSTKVAAAQLEAARMLKLKDAEVRRWEKEVENLKDRLNRIKELKNAAISHGGGILMSLLTWVMLKPMRLLD